MTDRRGQEPAQDNSDFYSFGTTQSQPMEGPEDMPETPWTDTVAASFRLSRRDIPGYNYEQATHEYKPLVDALTAANGKPWTLYVNPQTGQTDRDGVWAEITEWRRTHPGAFKGIPATREEYDHRASKETIRNRDADAATVARGAFSAQLVGGLGAGLTDPINLGTLGVGGPGATIAKRIIAEAAINAGIEAIEQPLIAIERAARGEKLTVGEAAVNVGLAGTLGGVFQGAISEPVGALLKRFTKAVPVEKMTDAERAAVGILEREAEIEALSPFEPGPATEVHIERLDRAMGSIAEGLPGAPPRPPSARANLRSGTALGSGVVTRPVEVSGAVARSEVKNRIRSAESSGNDLAANSRSSAYGRYQFTGSTWMRYYERRYGRGGLTDKQILAKRSDPAAQEQLMDDLIADNARVLARIGARETPGNLYLMHFAGEGGGSAILRAAPDTPIERILSPQAITANPFLRGKTARDVIEWANRKMGSRADEGPAVRRDAFPEGDEGDAAWRAAQEASDAAELERVGIELRPDEPSEGLSIGRSDRPLSDPVDDDPMGSDWLPISPEAAQRTWLEARRTLEQKRGGEVKEALYHPDVGSIDVKWGKAGTKNSDGYGLAKLIAHHPEVLDNLPAHLSEMQVVSRSKNRVKLESATHDASIRLEWDGKRQTWLLTAYERNAPASPVDARGDAGGQASPDLGAEVNIAASRQEGNVAPDMPRLDAQPAARPAPYTADGWSAVLKEAATKRVAPAAGDVALSSTESGLSQVIEGFGDPSGAFARAVADGLSHDLRQALDSGDLGDVAFAADGLEMAGGDFAPRMRTSREVLAELDADEAAIAALEACL